MRTLHNVGGHHMSALAKPLCEKALYRVTVIGTPTGKGESEDDDDGATEVDAKCYGPWELEGPATRPFQIQRLTSARPSPPAAFATCR